MKNISIQFNLENNFKPKKNEIELILNNAGFNPKITEGEDDGKYINYSIETNDLEEVWLKIQNKIINNPNISSKIIVVCEGSKGWDNYLLLYHFDQSKKLDKL